MTIETLTPLKIIFHVDIDAFFASVEQREHPEYRGKPIAVRHGGSETIAAASYEARAYGVRSGMNIYDAGNLCPEIIVVESPLERYVHDSRKFQEICISRCREFEPYSVSGVPEEGWMDYTGKLESWKDAEQEGLGLRNDIKNNTGLTASIGIAYAKRPAKMASDYGKPDGLVVIRNEKEFEPIFHGRGVRDLFGVGAAIERRLKELGLYTIGDIAQQSGDYLRAHFKLKRGQYLYFISRGVDEEPVIPYYAQAFVPKSIGRGRTVRRMGTKNFDLLRDILMDRSKLVGTILNGYGFYFKTVRLETDGYDNIGIERSRSRSRTLDYYSNDWREIYDKAVRILYGEMKGVNPLSVRKIGVRASNLTHEAQLTLFRPDDYKVL